MQANIELALKTREVFKLFERRIDGNRLFIEAILRKFNIVMKQCKQQEPSASEAYNQIKQSMLLLTRQFADEVGRFEAVLAKRNDFDSKRINFIAQFYPIIPLKTPLSLHLVAFIETYDKLIALIKLLDWTGFFTSNNDCYSNINRIQKLANQMLSHITLGSPLYTR